MITQMQALPACPMPPLHCPPSRPQVALLREELASSSLLVDRLQSELQVRRVMVMAMVMMMRCVMAMVMAIV